MPGTELYYLDGASIKQDSELHEEILDSEEGNTLSSALGALRASEILGPDADLKRLYGLTLAEAQAIVGRI